MHVKEYVCSEEFFGDYCVSFLVPTLVVNYSRNATADKYQLSREIYCIPLTPITSYFHTQERLPFMNGSLTDDDTMLRLIAYGHGRLFLRHAGSLLLPYRSFPSAADVWVPEGRERAPVRRRRAE